MRRQFCLKYYFQHHEDYRGLERAKEAMVDVAQYINDVKKDFDALNVVNAIQVC